MIDPQECFDMMMRSFQDSDKFFHWGDNMIIQGGLDNLPTAEEIQSLDDGKYFALIDVESINPEEEGEDAQICQVVYNYIIRLYRKGKTGDITQIKNDMVKKWSTGWHNFWMKQYQWKSSILNILRHEVDVESRYDVVGIQIQGSISKMIRKGGAIVD